MGPFSPDLQNYRVFAMQTPPKTPENREFFFSRENRPKITPKNG